MDHHASYCCVTPTSPTECLELGEPAEDGARRFLARVVAAALGRTVEQIRPAE